MKIQRFKASLTNGCWPENPEPLIRDESGDYCKFAEIEKLEAELASLQGPKSSESNATPETDEIANHNRICVDRLAKERDQLREQNAELVEILTLWVAAIEEDLRFEMGGSASLDSESAETLNRAKAAIEKAEEAKINPEQTK